MLGKIRKNFSSLFFTFIRRNILFRCFVDSKMVVSSSLSYEFSFSLLCNNIKSLMSTFYSRARFFSEQDLATFSLASLPFSTLFFRADFRDALNIAYFIIPAIYSLVPFVNLNGTNFNFFMCHFKFHSLITGDHNSHFY